MSRPDYREQALIHLTYHPVPDIAQTRGRPHRQQTCGRAVADVPAILQNSFLQISVWRGDPMDLLANFGKSFPAPVLDPRGGLAARHAAGIANLLIPSAKSSHAKSSLGPNRRQLPKNGK